MKEWGILVPLVTPCTPEGKLDVNGLIQVSSDMLNAGCHSLFVAGSTGRGPWFNRDERITNCRTVVDLAGPKIPVVAGCIALGLDEMLENSQIMADAGAKAAVITAPGYFHYSQEEIGKVFRDFADKSPLPVMLYDIPDFAGVKIDQNVILDLAKHENVIGFKDSTNDFDRFEVIFSHLQNRKDFYLFQGKERWLTKSLQMGASGFVVSMIHIEPSLFVGLYNAVRHNDTALATHLQNTINQVMDLVVAMFEKRSETSTLFHFLNHVLKIRKVCENIILDQDGECPNWLCSVAEEAYSICKTAKEVYLTK